MIHLYYHGGSANHGCEAIVRATFKILDSPLTLWSTAPDEDLRYGLDRIVQVRSDTYKPIEKNTLCFVSCALEHKLRHSDYGFVRAGHRAFLHEVHPGDLCLSVGGDNYCYPGVEDLAYYNRMLKDRGAKTVLWGCSIEPSALDPEVIGDLERYDLITVRESLTMEALHNAGIKDNVVLCADPAFLLEAEKVSLPEGFSKETTVGINVSPLVAACGKMVLENYRELIRYILEETEYNVLLIPHVVKDRTDDRQTLRQVSEPFRDNGRICLLEDQNCQKLKGYISQCRMFIGARTHATIAAYSTCVPTLVSGYSIKARGIARDLFGTDENYVLPVQAMNTPDDLRNAFLWLEEHAGNIRKTLEDSITEYSKRSYLAGTALDRLR